MKYFETGIAGSQRQSDRTRSKETCSRFKQMFSQEPQEGQT